MSFLARFLQALGAFVAVGPYTVTSTGLGAGSTAGIRFNDAGTVDKDQYAGGSGGWSHLEDWFSPTGAGDGTGYWIRYTKTAGTALTWNDASTWTQISGSPSCGLTAAGANSTITVEVATDSGGVNIIFTSTGNVLTANA